MKFFELLKTSFDFQLVVGIVSLMVILLFVVQVFPGEVLDLIKYMVY